MNKALEYSRDISYEVEEIEQALAAGDDSDWQDNILDIEYTANLDGNARAVSLLRTLGGPACTIQFIGNGTAYIKTEWGKDEGSWYVYAPNFEAAAFELVGTVITTRANF
jgi:hypothetical protein